MLAGYNKPLPLSTRDRLMRRSTALQKARAFFVTRNIVETDCFILGSSASIDLHIDLFSVASSIYPNKFLFSSPEYPMKRLLADHSGDIFYLGHVFRHEEAGRFHSPEFTMAEWYRIGYSLEQMIEESLEFIFDTIAPLKFPVIQTTYQTLFENFCSFNPHTIEQEALQKRTKELLQERNIEYDVEEGESNDALLHLLISCVIEPIFKKKKEIVVITDFPEMQAALAKKRRNKEGYHVSERFEIYVNGVEVANGYHELAHAQEQEMRFHEENRLRKEHGKCTYPIDSRFIEALSNKGLPDCSGVAIGFDRLLMIAWNELQIEDTVPLPWLAS